MTDLPPEPGTVPDLEHGIEGPEEDMPDDDTDLGDADAQDDDGSYDDDDDDPDQVGPGDVVEFNPDDGLDEPEDDSEDGA